MTASQYVYFVGAEEPAAVAELICSQGLWRVWRMQNEVLQATEGKRCVQIPTNGEEQFFFPKLFKTTLLTYTSC